MKIFAVARNYITDTDTGAESIFGTGETPIWYEIPDSAILRTRQPFFIPEFAKEFRAMPSIVIRISRLGKGIARRFADRYVDSWSIGCHVVAADLLSRLREEGLPWCGAIAFDKALLLGDFAPIETLGRDLSYEVSCGVERLNYSVGAIRHTIGTLIEEISRDNTLKSGDIILAGIHPYGIRLAIGTRLESTAEENETTEQYPKLEINIR